MPSRGLSGVWHQYARRDIQEAAEQFGPQLTALIAYRSFSEIASRLKFATESMMYGDVRGVNFDRD
jgi:hypothetical protein